MAVDKIKFISSIEDEKSVEVMSKFLFSSTHSVASQKTKSIVVHKVSYEATTVDTFDIVALSGVSRDKITFVVVDYKKQNSAQVDEDTPKTFLVKLQTVDIGTMSHLELVNLNGTLVEDLVISTLEDPAADEVNELTILIGTKI